MINGLRNPLLNPLLSALDPFSNTALPADTLLADGTSDPLLADGTADVLTKD